MIRACVVVRHGSIDFWIEAPECDHTHGTSEKKKKKKASRLLFVVGCCRGLEGRSHDLADPPPGRVSFSSSDDFDQATYPFVRCRADWD
jgi:hypothetical protein